MKNHFNGKLSGKGTAAIICFCLAAVAALGIFSYNKSAKELRSELSGVSSTSETAQTEQTQRRTTFPLKKRQPLRRTLSLSMTHSAAKKRRSPPPSRTLSQAQWYVPQTVRYWKRSLTASW